MDKTSVLSLIHFLKTFDEARYFYQHAPTSYLYRQEKGILFLILLANASPYLPTLFVIALLLACSYSTELAIYSS
jgi:surface polysaccharide O-acyltransferase-like enzyme